MYNEIIDNILGKKEVIQPMSNVGEFGSKDNDVATVTPLEPNTSYDGTCNACAAIKNQDQHETTVLISNDENGALNIKHSGITIILPPVVVESIKIYLDAILKTQKEG